MPNVIHIVHLSFLPDATAEQKAYVCNGVVGFKDTCLHPETKKPYILSAVGGIDNSIEGIQRGYTHTFVFEFGSIEDRNYYAKVDPAHMAFSNTVGGIVEPNVMAIDLTPGVF